MRRWHVVTEHLRGTRWVEMAEPGPERVFRFRRDAEVVAAHVASLANRFGQQWRISVRRRTVK